MHIAPPKNRFDPVLDVHASMVSQHCANACVVGLDLVGCGRNPSFFDKLLIQIRKQCSLPAKPFKRSPSFTEALVPVLAFAVYNGLFPEKLFSARAPAGKGGKP